MYGFSEPSSTMPTGGTTHKLYAHKLWQRGLKDALNLYEPARVLLQSKTVARITAQCLLLNGILFLGSMLLFDYAFIPFLHWLLEHVGPKNESLIQTLSSFDTVLTVFYNLLWLYPVYSISFVLNSIWYQEIGDSAYRFQFADKPPRKGANYESFVGNLAGEIYRTMLFGVFSVQAFAFFVIPYIGIPLSFVHFCWLYAFYCFDYKRMNQGWSLPARLDHFESHWAYFLGFGTPCTLATYFFPQFISSGIFAMIFPLMIILANKARPVAVKNSETLFPKVVNIFALAKRVNNIILRFGKRRQ